MSPSERRTSLRSHAAIYAIFIVATAAAGALFVFKLHEFLRTIRRDELAGFAFDPIVIYSVVAMGFTLLLFWAFLTGQFSRIEEPKFELLRRQDEIDAAEESLRLATRRVDAASPADRRSRLGNGGGEASR